MFFLTCFISSAKWPSPSSWTRKLSLFLFSWIFFGICPYVTELQAFRSMAQAFNATAIPSAVFILPAAIQAASIIFLHSSFLAHIASKWNQRVLDCLGALGSATYSTQWSEMESTRWLIFTSLNLWIQSIVVKALSNLRYILLPPDYILHQVKSGPRYPKSLNPQSLTTFLNLSIWLCDLSAPPDFSSIDKISLKSLIQNQGSWNWFFKNSSKFQDYCLIWVWGWP